MEKIKIISTTKSWIETDAISQLQYVSKMSGMSYVVGLPDLHPGRGYPIGMACLSKERLYPALIGNDIGCGMGFWMLDSQIKKVNLDRWEKNLRQSAFSDQRQWTKEAYSLLSGKLEANLFEERSNLLDEFAASMGTVGGGNHFAEIQKVKKVFSEEIFFSLGMKKKNLFVLVHSGSRGLGNSILRNHIDQYDHKGLVNGSDEAFEYLSQHDLALRWAQVNRKIIAKRIMKSIKSTGKEILDVNHNFMEQVDCELGKGWLHRKGATPSDREYVVIPGSRGSSSFLVKPKVSMDSLFSLAHGAGRKWKRSECEGRLRDKYKFKEMARTAIGSRVICDDKALVYEEAPEAYKSIDSVIQALLDFDLIELVAEFEPVLTYKNVKKDKACSSCY